MKSKEQASGKWQLDLFVLLCARFWCVLVRECSHTHSHSQTFHKLVEGIKQSAILKCFYPINEWLTMSGGENLNILHSFRTKMLD